MSAQNRETRKMVRVSAAKKWQGTDMWVTASESLRVIYLSGKWMVSPTMGFSDANGINVVAKPGYTYPGESEGKLIGGIGKHMFVLGNVGETPKGLEGELELCVNDDIDGRYGAGFVDNLGSIIVEIELHSN